MISDFSDIIEEYGEYTISRRDLANHNLCLPALMDFEDFFGPDPDKRVAWKDALPPWQVWLESLEDQELAKEWEEMTYLFFSSETMAELYGVELMATDTYHVFNTNTGSHEEVEGLEAAKARRQEIKNEYLQQSMGLFTVTQEFQDANGNVILKPVDQSVLES